MFLLVPLESGTVCQHFDSILLRPTPDFRSAELWGNTYLVFNTALSAAVQYSNERKLRRVSREASTEDIPGSAAACLIRKPFS